MIELPRTPPRHAADQDRAHKEARVDRHFFVGFSHDVHLYNGGPRCLFLYEIYEINGRKLREFHGKLCFANESDTPQFMLAMR